MRFVFKRPDYKDLVLLSKEGDMVRVPVVGERLLVPGESLERTVTSVLFRNTLKSGDIIEINLSNLSGVLISLDRHSQKNDGSVDEMIDAIGYMAGRVVCGTSFDDGARDWKPKKLNASVKTNQVVV